VSLLPMVVWFVAFVSSVSVMWKNEIFSWISRKYSLTALFLIQKPGFQSCHKPEFSGLRLFGLPRFLGSGKNQILYCSVCACCFKTSPYCVDVWIWYYE